MRYFFRVEYDGLAFQGWQRQPNGPSVQQALEEALSLILRMPIAVVGSGRTDTGVHARAQGVHFDCPLPLEPALLQRSLNGVVSKNIGVYDFRPVADDFHARYSAIRRGYKYRIAVRKSPLHNNRAWQLFYPVDWQRVQRSCEALLGEHDFSAFCASGATTSHARCTVHAARLEQHGELWVFSIEANRFVYRMVRSVVGTLVDIGRGILDEPMEQILAQRLRERTGETAPACGLTLHDVFYPGEL